MLTLKDAETSAVSPEDVKKVIASTKPRKVRIDEVQAGPVNILGTGEGQHTRLTKAKPAYAIAEDGHKLLVRLKHVLECADSLDGLDSEEDVTTIKVAHVIEFDVIEEVTVEESVIGAFIETNAYFFVYPYVRQLFTTLTAEMGIVPVALDYMHRDQWPFSESQDTKPDATSSHGSN